MCGYIVAVRWDNPWAYMVAIEPVLDDIKRMCETEDVRLPTALEVQESASSRINIESRMLTDIKSAVGAPAPKIRSEMADGNPAPELSSCSATGIECRALSHEAEPLNEKSPPVGEETGTSTIRSAYPELPEPPGPSDDSGTTAMEVGPTHSEFRISTKYSSYSNHPWSPYRPRRNSARLRHYLESVILRVEYRRAKRGWRVGWRSYRLGPRLFQILDRRLSRSILYYIR